MLPNPPTPKKSSPMSEKPRFSYPSRRRKQGSADAGAKLRAASQPAPVTHRPGETERQNDTVTFIAAAGLEVEGVAPDDRSGPRAEAAGPLGRDAGLVLLEAHFEVRVTLVAGALAVPRAPGTATAVPVLQLPVHVLHGQDLQLELAGGPAHLPARNGRSARGKVGFFEGGSGGSLPPAPMSPRRQVKIILQN